MNLWPEIRDGYRLRDMLDTKWSAYYWKRIFNKTYDGKIDTWDYQWTFSCWVQNSLTVIPTINLVSNIGFGQGAEHTKNKNKYSEMKVYPMADPLLHPNYVIRHSDADLFVQSTMFSGIFGFVMRIFSSLIYRQ